MHVLVQEFYFSISTMIMNVHVHGARCPNVLVCSSVLFAGRRVGDVTVYRVKSLQGLIPWIFLVKNAQGPYTHSQIMEKHLM